MMMYTSEKYHSLEKQLQDEKLLSVKWEASSKQNHKLVVKLHDKNCLNQHRVTRLKEEKLELYEKLP